jgi:hypothetical protein
MNIKLLKFNIFFEKPYIEGLFRSNSSWKLQYKESVGFFYQQFPRFPFHRPRSSPLEIRKTARHEVNTWIIQLSCTGICLCSWGEGAAAETYKTEEWEDQKGEYGIVTM